MSISEKITFSENLDNFFSAISRATRSTSHMSTLAFSLGIDYAAEKPMP